MIKQIVALVSFVFLNLCVFAQVKLTGTASSFPNQTVYIYRLSDALCQLPIFVGTAPTNEKGQFQFEFALNEISEISLRVGDADGHLWCEPNSSYTLRFLEEDLSQAQNSLTHNWDIQLDINESDINSLMYAFDSDYTTFITNNYFDYMLLSSSGNAATKERISKQNPNSDLTHSSVPKDSMNVEKSSGRFLKSVIQFEKDMHAKFGDYEKANPFFADYIFSKVKELRYTTLHVINEVEFEKHFQLNNPGSAQVLSMLAEYYLRPPMTLVQREELNNYISFEHSSQKVLAFLTRDSVHTYLPMNELMLAASLRQAFFTNLYKKQDVELVLQDLLKTASQPKTKLLCQSILNEVNSLKELRTLPPFTLTDRYGKKWELDKNANRFIYVYFFGSGPDSQRDLAYLNNIADNYYKDIHLVCIGMQKSREEFEKIISAFDNHHLTFLYAGMDQELIRAYQLKMIPAAFFADKDKKLRLNYAPVPSEGIERKFTQILLHSKK